MTKIKIRATHKIRYKHKVKLKRKAKKLGLFAILRGLKITAQLESN